MIKKISVVGVAMVMVTVALAFVLSGCEDKGTVGLTVSPSFADISAGSSNVWQTFTVTDGLRDLSLPLTWEVSNPDLGSIAGTGGDSASYARNPGVHGDNSIIVHDQYGAEGVATVRQ